MPSAGRRTSTTQPWKEMCIRDRELNQYIENKNYFAVEGLLKNQPMDEVLKQAFLKLPELFGALEQMQEANNLTSNPAALAAIELSLIHI